MPRPEDEYTDEPPRRPRDDEDEGYSDAPRARRRRGEGEDDYDEPPRRRRRDEDEDYDEDRPRRRRRSVAREDLNWLDQQFLNTSMVLLVLFPLCCGLVALVFAISGVAACSHPEARRRALVVLIISLVWMAVVIPASILMNASK
jgi:hypothetical protein